MHDLTAEERAFLKHILRGQEAAKQTGNYNHGQWDLLVKDGDGSLPARCGKPVHAERHL